MIEISSILVTSSDRTSSKEDLVSFFSLERSIIPWIVKVMKIPRITERMLLRKLVTDSFMAARLLLSVRYLDDEFLKWPVIDGAVSSK